MTIIVQDHCHTEIKSAKKLTTTDIQKCSPIRQNFIFVFVKRSLRRRRKDPNLTYFQKRYRMHLF